MERTLNTAETIWINEMARLLEDTTSDTRVWEPEDLIGDAKEVRGAPGTDGCPHDTVPVYRVFITAELVAAARKLSKVGN